MLQVLQCEVAVVEEVDVLAVSVMATTGALLQLLFMPCYDTDSV